MGVPCPKCTTPLLDGANFCGACGSPASPLTPRSTTGGPAPGLPPRYRVLRFLGRGGMGRVFLCHDAELDVDVAVKVLPPEVAADTESLELIRKEARAAARFRDCRLILSLYGFETHGDTSYLVMEYVAGGSLHDLLKKEKRLDEARVRRLGAEVADALAFSHSRNILHRDIKPANVLLTADEHVKVADFGIAKVMADTSSKVSLVTVAGTPIYMPPEIFLQGRVDRRADLYSLGCMLYEMATGERPFGGSYAEIAMVKAGAGAKPPDPRTLRPELTEEFSAIVRRLLEPDPEKRFPDGTTLAQALRRDGIVVLEEIPVAPTAGIAVSTATATLPPPIRVAGAGDSAAGATLAPSTGTAAPATLPGGSASPPTLPAAGGKVRSRGLGIGIAAAAVAGIGIAVAVFSGGGTSKETAADSKTPSADSGQSPVASADGAAKGGNGGAPAAPSPGPGRGDGGAPRPAPPSVRPDLRVLTTPPGAAVTLDGKAAGTAPEGGLKIPGLDPSASHLVAASLPDHDPGEAKVAPWSGDGAWEVTVALHRHRGTLRVSGARAGTRVVVTPKRAGGRPQEQTASGTTDLLFDLETGEYEVEAAMAGFAPHREPVPVAKGKEAVVRPGLKALTTTLTLTTDPPGAEVTDGPRSLGKTPLEGIAVEPGDHLLVIAHPDRDDYNAPLITVAEGEKKVVQCPPLPFAELSLEGLRPDVTALLDGRPVSGTVKTRSGPAEVVFRRSGFRDQTVPVVLRRGRPTPAAPGPWVELTSTLDLSLLPEGVRVIVDGEDKGRSPGVLTLPPGKHRVGLERTGYKPVPPREVDLAADVPLRLENPSWSADVTPIVPGLPAPPQVDLRDVALPAEAVVVEKRILWIRDRAEMVLVPGGTFDMGSPAGEAGGDRSEQPVHRVTVSPFLLDRHEVTNAQFAEFVKQTNHQTDAERAGTATVPDARLELKETPGSSWRRPRGPASSLTGLDAYPVVAVSWNDAAAYAAWAGKRLPTEAEFEFALRGGAAGERFPWGGADTPGRLVGNLADLSAEKTNTKRGSLKTFTMYDDGYDWLAPVGSFEANRYGLFDVLGNSLEWCQDRFQPNYYAGLPQGAQDPQGPETGNARVLRGSSFYSHPLRCRNAARLQLPQDTRHGYVGFRCAVTAPPGKR